MGWVVNTMPWLLSPWERGPLPIVQEVGWTPGLVWTGAENIDPSGIWSCPACSKLLYQLHHPGPQTNESAQFRTDCIHGEYRTRLESSVPGYTSEGKGNGDLDRQQVITCKVVPRCSWRSCRCQSGSWQVRFSLHQVTLCCGWRVQQIFQYHFSLKVTLRKFYLILDTFVVTQSSEPVNQAREHGLPVGRVIVWTKVKVGVSVDEFAAKLVANYAVRSAVIISVKEGELGGHFF